MEEKVHAFLKERDTIDRVFKPASLGGLFECLSKHVFKVKLEDFQKMFKSFMQRDEEKVLFKSILQLLDNTGNVPMKDDEESDQDFKTRLEECYDGITNKCSDIKPYSHFLHVYVFAIATLIGRPIFILHEDEAGDLSWSYFPLLYSHTFDLVRNKTEYTAQNYITMYFSTDQCYVIDSSMCPNEEPKSYGCIDVYNKRLKAILTSEDITKRCVRQMAQRIQRPEVQLELQGELSIDIMTKSIELYCSRSPGNLYSRIHGATLPTTLLHHNQNINDFVTQLLNDTDLLKCLFKVAVENKEGYRIWKSVASSKDGFQPLEFRKKLRQLEKSIFALQDASSGFVTRCTAVTQELSQRRGRVNRAVIGGSAVGIIGGGMAIAGLILTPFTFGASLGLTIAGASLGAAGGIAGGTARAVEGIKQNISIKEINEVQGEIAQLENNFVERIRDIELIIERDSTRNLDHTIEGPGMNRRGFLAVGSAFRSIHGSVAIALAAIRVGAVGATIAASVLGPLSLVLDVGFLAEAAHDLRTGCKTGAGRILEQNAMAIDMKVKFFMCMLRGNITLDNQIID